ncbi:MAG: bifunctional diaminohydroxyphosphoribosylaminopyrimidine deaminase/5-amino-6-(5-phosphoribosylamino)uracil reductase RibD [Planctomycetota bacterium]|nr:MAG: bifunctional diaminohydroxyphosphoribosylaminopyrimidine deaminase/5-amino-6-(5-phosphoribosylamino)uracil reductase RibD [Planctomycetota bacterium]
MATEDEKYMQMALKLARRGIGSVEPNPPVGAVLVKAGQVIGKGWHRKFGGPHAEINALEDCNKLAAKPQAATMYVTLEPCCHQGKTAPCTDAIINAKLAKVVVATIDPSQHANGQGVEQLRTAGIEVQTGVCEAEAKLLNAPFIKFAATGRCWVILKWAQSIDGKLAWAETTASRIWISGERSRDDAHKLRRRAGAVLVGINTVLADDPLLTARPDKGKQPTRVVLDSNLRIPLDCKLLTTAKDTPVLVVTSAEAARNNPQKQEQITGRGAEVLVCPETGRSNLHFLLDELSNRGVAQLLVEGGPTVIASFLKESLADEIVVYITPKLLGTAGSASISPPMSELTEGLDLHHVETGQFGEDIRLSGLTKHALDEVLSGTPGQKADS